MNRDISFVRGELVGAARALLATHMLFTQPLTGEREEVLTSVFNLQEGELRRLVNNEFQFHGNELGDPVQFALTILFMNGEEHNASGRHRK